jgi:hypothetical protein
MTDETRELIDTVRLAIQQALSNLHTAAVAQVVAVNSKTVDVRPVINRVVRGESVALPVFADVPPVFMQGGASYTAHPIAVGDYCLLVFAERCFDRWYDGQDFLPPLEIRMHDYSDAFAIVGINPLANAITIPAVIQQSGATNYDGDHTHQGDHEQTGDRTLVGDVDQTGSYVMTGAASVGRLVIGVGGSVTIAGLAGWSGTFATGDARTVTVTAGIITNVA